MFKNTVPRRTELICKAHVFVIATCRLCVYHHKYNPSQIPVAGLQHRQNKNNCESWEYAEILVQNLENLSLLSAGFLSSLLFALTWRFDSSLWGLTSWQLTGCNRIGTCPYGSVQTDTVPECCLWVLSARTILLTVIGWLLLLTDNTSTHSDFWQLFSHLKYKGKMCLKYGHALCIIFKHCISAQVWMHAYVHCEKKVVLCHLYLKLFALNVTHIKDLKHINAYAVDDSSLSYKELLHNCGYVAIMH